MKVRSPVVFSKNHDGSGFSYQKSRLDGVDERWEMIKPCLRENTSVLDVGCNAGMLTARVGETERFVVGIEKNSATVADAVEYHGLSREFGLLNKPITPENVQSLPAFDYIFMFSIYHQLYSYYGQNTAEALLSQVSQKVSDTLFFEAASQKSKYSDPKLSFEDFDEESIVEYNIDMLDSVIETNSNIEYIGSSSRREGAIGKRYLFTVEINKR
jgi:SAM-dependent methyltransferase